MDRAEAKMLVLGRPDVEGAVGFGDMIAAMEEAQRAWGNGHAVSNLMTGVHVPPEVSSGLSHDPMNAQHNWNSSNSEQTAKKG